MGRTYRSGVFCKNCLAENLRAKTWVWGSRAAGNSVAAGPMACRTQPPHPAQPTQGLTCVIPAQNQELESRAYTTPAWPRKIPLVPPLSLFVSQTNQGSADESCFSCAEGCWAKPCPLAILLKGTSHLTPPNPACAEHRPGGDERDGLGHPEHTWARGRDAGSPRAVIFQAAGLVEKDAKRTSRASWAPRAPNHCQMWGGGAPRTPPSHGENSRPAAQPPASRMERRQPRGGKRTPGSGERGAPHSGKRTREDDASDSPRHLFSIKKLGTGIHKQRLRASD